MSHRQQELFALIRKLVRDKQVPPTVAEIRSAGLAETSDSLRYDLRVLAEMGRVRLEKAGRETTIHLGERAKKEADIWRLVDEGIVTSWSGGKPSGSKRPIKLTPGPPISDYIIEERDRLRGPMP